MLHNETNSSHTTTISTKSHSATKLCHIIKRPDFEGYGFNLHSEKVKPGQFIGKVDPDSPAEEAGLKEGDRIVEVNGVPIGNETHKQVVQRIKAISSEVRLLLSDVDGKGSPDIDGLNVPAQSSQTPSKTENNSRRLNSNASNSSSNNENMEYKGIIQEIPGSSANISSISVISTKRSSSGSTYSTNSQREVGDTDITDNSVSLPTTRNGVKESSNTTICDNSIKERTSPLTANVNNISSAASRPPLTLEAHEPTERSEFSNPTNGHASSSLRKSNASLQLPLTAAEMRAKLMSKKKYDPKNESVDLKKKFEIIQKL